MNKIIFAIIISLSIITVGCAKEPLINIAGRYNNKGADYEDAGKYKEALDCYLEAHSLGLAEGTVNSARCYYFGIGTTASPQQALYILSNSNIRDSGYAYYFYALAYLNGKGVPKDYERGRYYMQIAHQRGCPHAAQVLNEIYANEMKNNLARYSINRNIASDVTYPIETSTNTDTRTSIDRDKNINYNKSKKINKKSNDEKVIKLSKDIPYTYSF